MHGKSSMLYLDNAATTPLLPEVRKVMINYMVDNFGNPSSIYKIGRMNKIAVEEARKSIAKTIGACPDDIFLRQAGLKVITGFLNRQQNQQRNQTVRILL